MSEAISHSGQYGQWIPAAMFAAIAIVFIAFLPFYRKSHRRPAGTYVAFVLAYALEMFGVPFSMYIVTWVTGHELPEGILWGHTLGQYIGLWGMYVGIAFMVMGVLLVVIGWRTIFKRYWSKVEGSGQLVTSGIYGYIRHPQYTGFLLVSLGMLVEWVTIPLLVMSPILVVLYYRLARREERDMEREFGDAYAVYRENTSMFLPFRWRRHRHLEASAALR